MGHHPDAGITALPTPKVGTTEYLTISDNPSVLDWFENLWRNFAFTPLANLCGIPAISLPLSTHEHGLPLGIQAIAKQANDTIYGLAASVWTRNGGTAHKLASRIRSGTVWINCHNVFDASLPFGGYKQSGWGREMGEAVLENYLNTKAVTIAL